MYRTTEIEITRHRPVSEPIKETVYGLFDDDRLVVYSPRRYDLTPAVSELNRLPGAET